MQQLLTLLTDVPQHLIGTAPAALDPGSGTAPGGETSNRLLTILQWVAWGVSVLAVLGVLICAGKMVISHRRGEAGEHASSLGWVLGGCVLAGSASTLVGTLIPG